MIDCENEVYTRIAKKLREEFPDIHVSGEYIRAPSSFPHVNIMMNDTAVIPERLDSSRHETDLMMFEINVYSNKTNGRKSECKTIMKIIDNAMFSMNFRRIALTPVPNLENATIYRMTARYRGASDGTFFYRR